MTLPRTVTEVLEDHVTFELECIDRMYLNVYVPKLMFPAGVAAFFKKHRGMPSRRQPCCPSPGFRGFDPPVRGWAGPRSRRFEKGQRKDDVALRYLAGHDGSEGILFGLSGRGCGSCGGRMGPAVFVRYLQGDGSPASMTRARAASAEWKP
jgi:hypothetical protein